MWYAAMYMCLVHSVVPMPPRCTMYTEKHPTAYTTKVSCMDAMDEHVSKLSSNAVSKGFRVLSIQFGCIQPGKDA